MIDITFRKYHPDAVIPAYQSTGAAGFDFHAVTSQAAEWVKAGERALISTQLAVLIPEGYEIQIRPRSGLALKHGITVLNAPGTIDCDYRGVIGIVLFNSSHDDFRVLNGDRIAQGVVAPAPQARIRDFNELWDTERGAGGFGSTG